MQPAPFPHKKPKAGKPFRRRPIRPSQKLPSGSRDFHPRRPIRPSRWPPPGSRVRRRPETKRAEGKEWQPSATILSFRPDLGNRRKRPHAGRGRPRPFRLVYPAAFTSWPCGHDPGS
ncbi:MAG: hypothetical protein C6P37_14460 [Caldibacillus debilis]|uniref:Uncharacterized protein n=1 Tax=Caldibacillus debilis TaxID=301148 RepID=A0A3E0K0A6_9BACI|nr:MAG: hypothetical protein C6P37_14460 [Caldibacillus debilis]